jgi:hypothetical protein
MGIGRVSIAMPSKTLAICTFCYATEGSDSRMYELDARCQMAQEQ